MWMIGLVCAAFAGDPFATEGLIDLPAPEIDDPSPIYFGEEEKGFPSTVSLGAFGFSMCTGSLITPRVILTAGHCSADLPMELIVQLGTAYVGDAASDPDHELSFSSAAVHPGYVPLVSGIAGTLGENDVAVLVLEEDAPVEPVWFRTEPLRKPETEGEEVISVGFGLSEDGPYSGGTKRSAPLIVSELDPMFLLSLSSDNENGANICSGDSGGPQYHVEPDGSLVQWAVHSWGDTSCLFESGSTRTDVVAEWILDQVELVHGTRDRCELYGNYGDGVCDGFCDEFDREDCLFTLADIPRPEGRFVARLPDGARRFVGMGHAPDRPRRASPVDDRRAVRGSR